ncbi:MAG: hypothetical protein ACREHE_07815 [Rhizomicrobium sp.]
MSDFLGRLLQRRQSPLAEVRPRPRALFEDGPVRSGPAMTAQDETVDAAGTPRSPRAASEPQPSQPNAPPEFPALRSDPPRVASRTLETATVPPQRASTEIHRESVTRIETRTVEIVEREPVAPFAIPARPEPALTAHPVRQDIRVAERHEPAARTEAGNHAPREPGNAAAPVVERIETRLPPAPPSATPDMAPPLAPVAAPSPPFERPLLAPPAQPPRRETEIRHADTEPVIQVTIGRIEVRAIEERETRPRKREAAAPVMSLDDYLRARTKQ